MSRSKLTADQIAERCVAAADRLFACRGELRIDLDVLQDAYDDATGLVTQDLYANPDVKETKDAAYLLDSQIGQVARQLEHLARVIRGIKKGTLRRW